MAPPALAPALAAALLSAVLLAPGLAAPALAQGAAHPPFEALPPAFTALAARWVEARAGLEDRLPEGADPNASVRIAGFRASAGDFLAEGRLSLAMAQLLQVDLEAATQRVMVLVPEGSDRERARAAADAVRNATNATRAELDALHRRLAADEGRIATVPGLERALLAAYLASLGDVLQLTAEEVVQQLDRAAFLDPRLVRVALAQGAGGSTYAGFARDLLDAALAAPGRALPAGGLAAALNATQGRMGDPLVSSSPGLGASKAFSLVRRAESEGGALNWLGAFLTFQQARTGDALDFLLSRRELTDEGLRERIAAVVGNATLAASYDGALARAPPGMVARARASGLDALIQLDALNHARYVLELDRSSRGGTGAWAILVVAAWAAEAGAAAAPAPAAPAEGWMVYGGIAVAAALAVAAFAMLRRPARPPPGAGKGPDAPSAPAPPPGDDAGR